MSVWVKLSVADIGVPQVLAVLEQSVDGGGTFWDKKTVTASRTRNRIELILTMAAARGYRSRTEPNHDRLRASSKLGRSTNFL